MHINKFFRHEFTKIIEEYDKVFYDTVKASPNYSGLSFIG